METPMEEVGPLRGYESESIEDLKQMLLHARLELESTNKVTMELFNLLNIVYHERYELREALAKTLHKLPTTSSLNVPNDNIVPKVIPETLVAVPNTKTNSRITESNNRSHGSSTVDSFLHVVSSPELSKMNDVGSQNVGFLNLERITQRDPASVAIENMIKGKALPEKGKLLQSVIEAENMLKGKALPEKGKLLQSVMEAGPLLQTLLVARPVPCWRNPPPTQAISLPPFNLKDFESPTMCSNHSGFSMKAQGTHSSAPMLNFAINNPVSCQSNLTPSFGYQVPPSKRQRR